MFRSGAPHRPFFEIGPLEQPEEKKETKLIPLTKEDHARFQEMTTIEVTTVNEYIYLFICVPI